jgi:hypothetical protein
VINLAGITMIFKENPGALLHSTKWAQGQSHLQFCLYVNIFGLGEPYFLSQPFQRSLTMCRLCSRSQNNLAKP